MKTEIRNNLRLIVTAFLIVVLPLLLYLVSQTQIFKPRAAAKPIEFFGNNVVIQNSGKIGFTKINDKATIGVRLTSPFGPPSGGPIVAGPVATPPPNQQIPTTSPTTIPAPTTPVNSVGSYNMKVLVIKYFPTIGGNLDPAYTGDDGVISRSEMEAKTTKMTNNMVNFLTKATKYLGYKNPSAQPSLVYSVVDTKVHNTFVPFDPGDRRPKYREILEAENICDYVNQGVKEVWLWAYQGGVYPGTNVPYLGISESKMSGPHGDYSNSNHENDMPKCGNKTYILLGLNYYRGTGEAMHSWGHQLESEMDAVDEKFFRFKFQGVGSPVAANVPGRCGTVHIPPNANGDYDYENRTPHRSDCIDWNPDSIGTLSDISCQNWSCTPSASDPDSDNPGLNYYVWNWQNLPGKDNTKTYQGKQLRNFWEIHGDFDRAMTSNRSIFK